MKMRPKLVSLASVLTVAALTASACGSGSASSASKAPAGCSSPSGASGPGTGTKTIGFIYTGSRSDYGYNEAAHEGAMAVKKSCPNLKILEADSIPETSEMSTVAEQMIGQGAKVIFTTSYGYKDFAVALAKKHPDVAVLQEGNFIDPPLPKNVNTFFGDVFETVYLAGIAAGKASKSNKLGFVAAFPISQTLLNVNAFQLGAQSANPSVKTYAVFTGSWCDAAKQADVTNALLNQGVDVLTQHQDCSGTIIKAAEARGAYSVGYHYDARSLAPKGWLTGSVWRWGPLYTAMVQDVLSGHFAGGRFNGNFRLGYASTTIASPLQLASFGPSVTAQTQQQVAAARKKVLGGWSPFTGPIYDQSGQVQVQSGKAATDAQLEKMSYLVKGVVGTLPSGK